MIFVPRRASAYEPAGTVHPCISRLPVVGGQDAVMSKLCHVLCDQMGVKPSNIFIFDGKDGSSMGGNVWKGLPEGVNAAGTWGGIDRQTTLQTPLGPVSTQCLGHLVTGEVDIVVNVGLWKGHTAEFGAFTMCMKNHFGTFNPGPGRPAVAPAEHAADGHLCARGGLRRRGLQSWLKVVWRPTGGAGFLPSSWTTSISLSSVVVATQMAVSAAP